MEGVGRGRCRPGVRTASVMCGAAEWQPVSMEGIYKRMKYNQFTIVISKLTMGICTLITEISNIHITASSKIIR